MYYVHFSKMHTPSTFFVQTRKNYRYKCSFSRAQPSTFFEINTRIAFAINSLNLLRSFCHSDLLKILKSFSPRWASKIPSCTPERQHTKRSRDIERNTDSSKCKEYLIDDTRCTIAQHRLSYVATEKRTLKRLRRSLYLLVNIQLYVQFALQTYFYVE